MIGHRLFASKPIGSLFYLHAVIFEIPKQYFIIKPPACWGADVSIEIYELLLLFSIITPSMDAHSRGSVLGAAYIKIFSLCWSFNLLNRDENSSRMVRDNNVKIELRLNGKDSRYLLLQNKTPFLRQSSWPYGNFTFDKQTS